MGWAIVEAMSREEGVSKGMDEVQDDYGMEGIEGEVGEEDWGSRINVDAVVCGSAGI